MPQQSTVLNTPLIDQVVLSSSYEDHLVGVHLANKEEQDAAMQVIICLLGSRSEQTK